MSHFTDEQFETWLDSWAKWNQMGKAGVDIGYKSPSYQSDKIQVSNVSHLKHINTTIEESIDAAVGQLAVVDRLAADVGRFEYGALSDGYNPIYDGKPNRELLARRLTAYLHERNALPSNRVISKDGYSKLLKVFKIHVAAWVGGALQNAA